jgi:transcription antitermination factor NusG
MFEETYVESAWHALYTRHQHEKRVAECLAGKGHTVYAPTYPALHRWKDRMKWVSLPLYPCYVFVKGGLERKLEIITTPGVFSIVGTSGGPSPIPDVDIESVRRILESRSQVEPYPYLNCGDRVRIAHGPLEGIEGILVRKKGSYRLVLSVELLRKSVAVEVEEASVEKLESFRSEFLAPVLA